MEATALDRWVNDNNIPSSFEFGKGWWDYIELVRLLSGRLETDDVHVVGEYIVNTPPPAEQLPMPIVRIQTARVGFTLRFDFGELSLALGQREWAVSVERESPYTGPWFGLINPTEDLRSAPLDGLGPNALFGSYQDDPARFTCLVRDEWDVAMLMHMMAHEL